MIASSHRAAVDTARQPAEKTTLNNKDGREIPCQPCRNSSTSRFAIGRITSGSDPRSGQT
jgi:hypothetical protein